MGVTYEGQWTNTEILKRMAHQKSDQEVSKDKPFILHKFLKDYPGDKFYQIKGYWLELTGENILYSGALFFFFNTMNKGSKMNVRIYIRSSGYIISHITSSLYCYEWIQSAEFG